VQLVLLGKENAMRVRSTLFALLATAAMASAANAQQITAYYQPTPYPSAAIGGTHVVDGWLNNSFNQSFVLDDKVEIGGWGDNYRMYVQFNTEGLPLNVSNALLMLYAYPRNDGSTLVNFDLWRPGSPWVTIDSNKKMTTAMTWGTQPSGLTYLSSWAAGANNSWWGGRCNVDFQLMAIRRSAKLWAHAVVMDAEQQLRPVAFVSLHCQ
jgi:hypothetical protein